MTSTINWQKGTPNEIYVSCLVTLDNGIVTTDTYTFDSWRHYDKEEIVAWCPLKDIEPYKEKNFKK
jgi:hypothetical protein